METMHKIRLLLLGEIGAGKSNIYSRILFNTYEENSPATVGIDFKSIKISLADKSILRLQFWDTSGQ
jgi:Ras-related protein Rab-11A